MRWRRSSRSESSQSPWCGNSWSVMREIIYFLITHDCMKTVYKIHMVHIEKQINYCFYTNLLLTCTYDLRLKSEENYDE